MAERVTNGVDHRTPTIPADHSRHDRLLVTRFAADDAYPEEAAQARALIDGCADCAALATDIGLLMNATSRLPAARRTRDFRLSHEQAESLRGSRLERLLRRLAAPGLAPLRPVAGVALSIGLVMAVVGVALPSPAMPATLMNGTVPEAADFQSAPEPAEPAEPAAEGEPDAEGQPAADTPSAATPEPAAEQPVPAAEPQIAAGDDVDREGDRARYSAEEPTPEPGAVGAVPRALEDPEVLIETSGTDAFRAGLVYGGLGIALISLALLVLIVLARRNTRDPLLR